MFVREIGHRYVGGVGDASAIGDAEEEIKAAEKAALENRRAEVVARIHGRGRMTAYERVKALFDDAPIWYLGAMMSWAGEREKSPGLGVICAFGAVMERMCIVIANDNTVSAGVWWPGTAEKIQRAQAMAQRLHIPVIYLVECAGLYLPEQAYAFGGTYGAGGIFESQARLNRAGIVQLAGIFGDCIAGGGYMPLLCDKIVMTESATICIGGTSLNRFAHGVEAQRLGGAEVHVHLSQCAEARVCRDEDAIAWLREAMRSLPCSAHAFYRIAEPVEPVLPLTDLYHFIPRDVSQAFDMVEVIARLVDGGQVQILGEGEGDEIFAALGTVLGLGVVFIGNRGVATKDRCGRLCSGNLLYRGGIEKIKRVSRAAADDGVPVVYMQDVSGFEIGESAEKEGLLKHGAALLRTLTEEGIGSLTIILRKASGAGYYAMKGAPFRPGWTVGTALSRLEVMNPETLASTMYDAKISRAAGEQRDALMAQKEALIAKQESEADVVSAISRGDMDTFVALSSLRTLVESYVSACWQGMGRAVKPHRLWSLCSEF